MMKSRALKPISCILAALFFTCLYASSAYSGAGNALNFHSDTYLDMYHKGSYGYVVDLSPKAFTVEFWFKGSSAEDAVSFYHNSSYGLPIMKITQSSSYPGGYWLEFDEQGLSGSEWNVALNMSGASNQVTYITNNQWHHIAITYEKVGNRTNFKSYIDGTLMAENPNYPSYRDGWLDVPMDMKMIVSPVGLMDELRVWSIARSQSEIQSTMNAPLQGNEANLKIYYSFDSLVNTHYVPDLSPNTYESLINNTIDLVASDAPLNFPAVRTDPATDVTFSSAQLNGEVTTDGGDGIIASGFYWATHASPSGSDNVIDNLSPGVGSFSGEMTFLTPQTTYYYRAYAANPNVTVYGDVLNFTTPAEPIPDPPGYALLFDGDDSVTLGNAAALSFAATAPFTIEAWIRPDHDSTSGTIISKYDSTVAEQFYLGLEGGIPVVHRGDGGPPLAGTTALTGGNWYHLAAVYDGTDLTLYLDGNLEGSQTSGSVADSTTAVLIGARFDNSALADWFTGAIDEIRIWDIDRSQSVIASGMTTRLIGSETNLVAWYNFDYTIEGTGLWIEDKSINSNHGTTQGDPYTIISHALGVPAIQTIDVEVVGLDFATLSGNLVQEGVANVIDWGICYNTTGNPQYSDSRAVGGEIDPATGHFDTVIKGLSPGIVYFARAYAVNSSGVGYGEIVQFTTAMVPPGNALDFDNDQDGVYIEGYDLSGKSAFTVEFWLKATDVGAAIINHGSDNLFAFGLESQSYQRGHYLFSASSNPVYLPMDDVGRGLDAADDQWHHVAVTFEENAQEGFISYFDGELIASRSTIGFAPIWTRDPLMLLGDSLYFSDAYLRGQMDEIRIWNRSKTSSEIRQDRFRTFYGNEPDLDLYYRCDHTTGALLEDAGPNGFNGFLGGVSPMGGLGSPTWSASGAPLGVPIMATETQNLRPVSTARITGIVQDDNNNPLTDQGIVWNTSGFPTTSDNRIPAGQTVNSPFSLDIPNLTAETTYYVRAYGENSAGIGYGNQLVLSPLMPGAGNSLSFDGIDDTVRIADPFSNQTEFTISVWVKPASINDGSLYGIIGYDGTYHKPSLWVNSETGGLLYDSYSDQGVRFSGVLDNFFTAADEWVHIGWVKSGTDYRFYRNGSLVATVAAPDTFWTDRQTPYYISLPQNPFFGEIDELRIHSQGLSGQDMADSYSSPLSGSETHLTAYYSFNQSDGNLLADASSSMNHGVLESDPTWSAAENLPVGRTDVWVDDNYGEFSDNDGRVFGIDAFTTIKPALAAVLDNGTVHINDGEYKGAGNSGLLIKDRSISVLSVNGPDRTIINPEFENISFWLYNSNAAIDGLTIYGGGMLIYDGSPAITNCRFIRNIGSSMGAIMVFGPTMVTTPVISDSVFLANGADSGAAILVADNSDVLVRNSVFMNNIASINGGAIAVQPVNGSTLPARATIVNSTFMQNEAASGGAIWSSADSASGQSAEVLVANSILWGSDDQIATEDAGAADISYSAVQGGFAGTGNIGDDPRFLYAMDPHIKLDSPCIDAGTTTPPGGLPTYDIYGNSRAINGSPDMGAHEILAGSPLIGLSVPIFDFTGMENGSNPADQYMLLKNGGDGTLNYLIDTVCPWLTIVPRSGSLSSYSDFVNLHVDLEGVPFGLHTCFVKVTSQEAPNSPRMIPVSVNVRRPLIVDPGDPSVFSTIQEAIDAAEDGETVIVKDGVYTGTGNVSLSFHDGFGSFKAITVRSENGPDNCILDAENNSNTRGITFSHGETPDVVFEGFTIRNGNQYAGGGIYILGNSSPTIRNCIIENSYAETTGGGIMVDDTASPTIINCRIRNNQAPIGGAGLFLDDSAAPLIINSLITGNTTLTGDGAGILAEDSTAPELINVAIADNSSVQGGAIYSTSSAPMIISNSLIWGNGQDQIDGAGVVTISYSSVEGGYSGVENLDEDPLFIDPAGEDYSLAYNSTAINSGSNGIANLPDEDISGRSRILEGRVDQGPHEHGAAEITEYLVGDVPDQVFSPGYSINFTIFSDRWGSGENIDILYGYSVAWGSPSGSLILDSETGVFQFQSPAVQTGDPADNWRPFAITFTATANSETVRQTVTFNSGYELPREYEIITANLPTPDPADNNYIVRNEQWREADPGENFNWLPNPAPGPPPMPLELATVDIAGKMLVIESGHENRIHDDYHGRKNIESMTLYAETVIIRDPFQLAQTNVTIYAKDLIFEDDGRIITTPDAHPQEKAVDAEYITDLQTGEYVLDGEGNPTYTEPGIAVDGLPAGSLTLEVGEIDSGYSGSGDKPVRFELTGSTGQGAGQGLGGFPGQSVSVIPGATTLDVHACEKTDLGGCFLTTNCEHKTNFDADTIDIVYCHATYVVEWYQGCGSTSCDIGWPGDGSDAVAASRPGTGGEGGDLSSAPATDSNGWPLVNFLANDGGPSGSGGWNRYGGPAGLPRDAVKYRFTEDFGGIVIHGHSDPGEDAPAPDGFNGQPGVLNSGGEMLSWLHPYSLKMILAHARDVYLNEHPQETRSLLADYPQWIDDYLAANPTTPHELSLMQLRDEMLTLFYQIDLELDYFANPPGWAPMLSFEITRTAYQNEIEHALQVLYLSHWIGEAQKQALVAVDALGESKVLLETEIDQFEQEFVDSQLKLDELQSQSIGINAEIERLREELREKQQTIQQMQVGVSGAEFGLTNTSKLLAMVPNAGSFLSGALNLGVTVGQNIPLPLNLVGQVYEDVSTHIVGSEYPAKADEVEAALGVEPRNIKQILERAGAIAKGLGTISDIMGDSSADPGDIISALNKLRGSYPFLSGIISDTITLMQQKLDYGTMIEETMERIATLPNLIANNQIAVTHVERYLSETGNVVLDAGDMVYLDDMQRRARERLIRYHYYMAKSYTYRMLAPYPHPHDLTYLLDDIITLVTTDLSQAGEQDYTPQYKLEVNSQDFSDLKTLFEEELWSVADEILTGFLGSRGSGELSTSVSIGLSEEEVQLLNENGEVTINLFEKGFFDSSKEDIRLVDLSVDEVVPVDPDLDLGNFASVEIMMKHSGRSRLMHDNQTFFFQHHRSFGSGAQGSEITWGATYDYYASTPGESILNPITPSEASDSLLLTMLDAHSKGDHIMIYSRPGAWADLVITASSNTDSGEHVELAELSLNITYDWSSRPAGTMLKVRVDGGDILPQFQLYETDLLGRKDGRGSFIRVFNSSLGSVDIEAQQRFGPYVFDQWTNRQGNAPAGVVGDLFSNSISADLSIDRDIKARYFLDADGDFMEDSWETEHFGNTEVSDGTSDTDNDGLSDFEEAQLKTDPNSTDSDGDGMTDAWEAAHGLDPNRDDAMENPDGDAAPNIAEFQADTDPNDDQDIPQLDSVLEDFESGDLSRFNWLTSGDASWEVIPKSPLDGAFSARSPALLDDQFARLETDIFCEAGPVIFTYRVSSEYCGNVLCDGLVFSIDGAPVSQFTGETGIHTVSFEVTAGQHTFSWEYSKDSSDFAGDDRAVIDNIWFPAALFLLDTDKDGMPDDFEIAHVLNQFLDDTGDDKDGDLFSNGREFEAGTSPSNLNEYPLLPGDVDRDGDVDLIDACSCLQLLIGMEPEGANVKGADVNNDGRIGLEDILYILMEVANN